MLYNGLLVSHLGFGGQAEVFLNLLIIAAAWLAHEAVTTGRSDPWLLRAGMAAMLLCGLAIQVKPTGALPGMFIGLALLWAAWLRAWNLPRMAGAAALWIALALLPTALVVLYYAWHGLISEWLFANLLSIFEKAPDRAAAVEGRMADTWLEFGRPFARCASTVTSGASMPASARL